MGLQLKLANCGAEEKLTHIITEMYDPVSRGGGSRTKTEWYRMASLVSDSTCQ